MWRFSIVSVVALTACGGESSPVDKCDDLVDRTCDRAVECIPNAGTHTQCVQEIQQALPCGSAKKVSTTYSRCMDQLESFSCSVLFPTDPQTGMPSLELPADCEGVILTRTSQEEPNDETNVSYVNASSFAF